jgi:Ferritin-like
LSSRLTSRLVWRTVQPHVTTDGLGANIQIEAESETAEFAVHCAPREKAIRLLWIGAEVEHALMVQYLYAAYSLNEQQADEGKREAVLRWRRTILEIAREEMGHLATVENLLTLIGGPLHFDREDFPIEDPALWPFPFQLEPLTKLSLAKYVLAETPSENALAKLGLKQEIDAIKRTLKIEGNVSVHRVGKIYDRLNSLFNPGPMIQGPPVPPYTDSHKSIATVDIQAGSEKYQVTPGAWGLGNKDIYIETAHDRDSAQAGLKLIAEQGEGSDLPLDLYTSHFGKFLNIYREFPEEGEWRPSRNVATNPSTSPQVLEKSRGTEGDACSWAELSNLRYRMLLLYLHHSFLVEAPAGCASHSPRGSLVSWTFGEMYNLRSLSEILMDMPLQPSSKVMAGPPFEVPYSVALAAREADRWRAHRDLLDDSIELIGEMLKEAHPSRSQYLRALLTSDQTTLDQVTALIGA